jgi:hypothetical protein
LAANRIVFDDVTSGRSAPDPSGNSASVLDPASVALFEADLVGLGFFRRRKAA